MECVFEDLLGIPFKLHGRDKGGFDCYGLVLEVSKRLGHKMIDLDRSYNDNNEKDLNENIYNITKCSGLIKTTEKEYGNIILFYDNKGRVCHIGVFLKHDDFLHCDGEGVRISKLSTYYRKWEIYKWQR